MEDDNGWRPDPRHVGEPGRTQGETEARNLDLDQPSVAPPLLGLAPGPPGELVDRLGGVRRRGAEHDDEGGTQESSHAHATIGRISGRVKRSHFENDVISIIHFLRYGDGRTLRGMVQVALAGLVALAVSNGIGRFAFTPLLPMMQQDAGLSLAAGGWLASANYLGYLLGALSTAALPVRPAMAIRAGLVTIVVVTLGMGASHTFVAWVALRAIAGIASAWVFVFTSSWCLDRLAHSARPLLNGVVFAGVGSGIALAGVICLA